MEDKIKFRTIEEYVSSFPENVVTLLVKLRAAIRNVVPDAEEVISYNIGSFKLNGSVVIYYAGWKQHISIYPVPSGNAAFKKAVSPYLSGKSTLKFPIDEPIPWKLIAEAVEFSLADNGNIQKAKKSGGKSPKKVAKK